MRRHVRHVLPRRYGKQAQRGGRTAHSNMLLYISGPCDGGEAAARVLSPSSKAEMAHEQECKRSEGGDSGDGSQCNCELDCCRQAGPRRCCGLRLGRERLVLGRL